jgi:hypothetical protein
VSTRLPWICESVKRDAREEYVQTSASATRLAFAASGSQAEHPAAPQGCGGAGALWSCVESSDTWLSLYVRPTLELSCEAPIVPGFVSFNSLLGRSSLLTACMISRARRALVA